MDALKAAVLQAEEDSHMRHTPLRQAFNALKNLKNLQLQGGGGAIEESTVKVCLENSMVVSATHKPYQYGKARISSTRPLVGLNQTLDLLEIGTLTWQVGSYLLVFSLTPHDKENTKVEIQSPWTTQKTKDDVIQISAKCPWVQGGFNAFQVQTKSEEIQVNVYCSIPRLATKINAAFQEEQRQQATHTPLETPTEQEKRWAKQQKERKEAVMAEKARREEAAEKAKKGEVKWRA